MRQIGIRTLILGTILLQGLSPAEISAQSVRGQLLDMAAGTPIVLAQITLLDVAGEPIARTITDTDGSFLLTAPEAGEYWIMGGEKVVFRSPQPERLIGPPPEKCFPQVYMDGGLISPGGRTPADLDRIPLTAMEAIEVYERATNLPGRFLGGYPYCGTIVLWTRAGRSPPRSP